MLKFRRISNNEKGVVLIAGYLVIAALLGFVTALVSVSTTQNSIANSFKRQTQAFDIAESGLDSALFWLRAQPAPPVGSIAPLTGNVNAGAYNGSYTVTLTDLGAQGGVPSIRRYKVSSTGTIGGKSKVLTNFLETDNYARYIWFTDSESFSGTTVWFWNQDYLSGPTQTNSHFNISGNPVFNGEVQSVDSYLRYYNNGNNINSSLLSNPPYDNPNFMQGVTLGGDPVNMPSSALNLRTAAQSGESGKFYLTGDTTIVLNADGTMNVSNDNKSPKWNNKNMALPVNGALFVNNGNLTISGTLKGRLTTGASKDIYIPSNIVYSSDPRINPNSTDTMGIISEGDVVINHDASYNLEIDAAIMAMNTSFMLDDWSQGPAKGTLTVYGGIIQDQRGPVGTFNGQTNQKVSGYSKNYSYDPRLLNSPPPFYPTTGDYITLSWEED